MQHNIKKIFEKYYSQIGFQLREKDLVTGLLFQLVSNKINYYWLGTIELKANDSRSFLWWHYDNEEADFTDWFDSYPKRLSENSCVVVRRECASTCTLKWQNRLCDETLGISGVICESRGE